MGEIDRATDYDVVSEVGELGRSFIQGAQRLSALDLCLHLEKCTPLLLFHLLPRKGTRNQLRSGLQQSYGDHIRVLSHAIDVLATCDAKWLLGRAASTGEVDERTMAKCCADFASLRVQPEEQFSLWLAACLHDYGKLGGRPFGLDAEDAVTLAAPLLDRTCPGSTRSLVEFVVRNHDIIEYVWAGETPPEYINHQLANLVPAQQKLALAFLGVIQLTGAASLGEGRVTSRKAAIFSDCLNGQIVQSSTVELRLARLIGGEQRFVSPEILARIRERWRLYSRDDRELLENFLSTAVMRGWEAVRGILKRYYSQETDVEKAAINILTSLVPAWHRAGCAGFVILGSAFAGKVESALSATGGTNLFLKEGNAGPSTPPMLLYSGASAIFF